VFHPVSGSAGVLRRATPDGVVGEGDMFFY
jgi:hypothetical protein